jgi:hypothetical protein
MIMLRTLREAVLADEIGGFSAVVVNGSMSFKDKATGQQRYEYLMSLHGTTEQVRAIDFANVDPKICFKSLKGISSPRPSQCIPIAPILRFDKDRRVISLIAGMTPPDRDPAAFQRPFHSFVGQRVVSNQSPNCHGPNLYLPKSNLAGVRMLTRSCSLYAWRFFRPDARTATYRPSRCHGSAQGRADDRIVRALQSRWRSDVLLKTQTAPSRASEFA